MKGKGGDVFGNIFVIIFGSLWTAMAIGMTSMAPGEMWFVKIIFPAFGFLFVSLGIYNLVKGIKGKDQKHNYTPYYTDSLDQEQEEKEYKVYREDNRLRCPMCNSEIKEEQKFCTNCGNKLKD
ncbi:MAG TPA: zinc ribbon domain-containing protein [Clostridia bacterium]